MFRRDRDPRKAAFLGSQDPELLVLLGKKLKTLIPINEEFKCKSIEYPIFNKNKIYNANQNSIIDCGTA